MGRQLALAERAAYLAGIELRFTRKAFQIRDCLKKPFLLTISVDNLA
jgi:hypothetical protein